MALIYISLPILILDQLTKFIILKNLHPGQSIPVIKNIFHITLVHNQGIAFGIFSGARCPSCIWVAVICLAAVIILAACYKKLFYKDRPRQVFLSLILAGASGNLIDRLRLGYVVDFLDFRIWPVFNIADSAITVGVALLLLQVLRQKNVSHTFPVRPA